MPFWKNWPTSSNLKFQSLDLRTESGQKQVLSPEMDGALRGELSTLNFGESPSVAVESRLSWILEDNVPERYYLSARACEGILSRASRRGKALPEILHTALLDMIEWWKEQPPTMRTDGGLSAMPTVLCRAHGQANAETLDDCCPTLNCNHEQPIVFESHSQDARYTQQGDTSPACTAQCGTGGNNMPLVAEKHEFQNTGIGWWNQSETGATLRTPCGGDSTKANVIAEKRQLRWIVRRLTPTECERLQGFPDGWTDIGEWVDTKGKRRKTTDSPRYKALGNSIALPQWWWITCKMARYLPEKSTLGSLFDGIGGFPLVWETKHGKGTAVWASEIEEFPIAVTKMRFGEEVL